VRFWNRFTMEEDFYRGRLSARHGLDVIIPTADQRELVHRIIYDELCAASSNRPQRGSTWKSSKVWPGGCSGDYLGARDWSPVKQEHSRIPLFDTTVIHAGGCRGLRAETLALLKLSLPGHLDGSSGQIDAQMPHLCNNQGQSGHSLILVRVIQRSGRTDCRPRRPRTRLPRGSARLLDRLFFPVTRFDRSKSLFSLPRGRLLG